MTPYKRNKSKHIKKSNLYIPCIDNITTNDEYFEEWYKYSKQFVDPFTFGYNKFHRYPKNDIVNSKGKAVNGLVELAQSHYKKPYYCRQIRKSDYYNHFNATNNQMKLFTTNHFYCSVWSSILDIDEVKSHHSNYIEGRETTPDDILDCRSLLQEKLPDCYYAPSTNGGGLHYRILIDCEVIKQDYEDRYPNMNYTSFVNNLIGNKSDSMDNPSLDDVHSIVGG